MKTNVMKKVAAIALSAMLVGAATVPVWADPDPAGLTNGEVGGFTAPDTTNLSNKKIKIAKELTAYNVDETTINAPTISYTYTIDAGDADKSITDEATDHSTNMPATVNTHGGITQNVSLSDSGVVAWTTDDSLDAASGGAQNLKYLTIDFTNVVFRNPGVYRYVLTEALTSGTYAQTGVTENTAANHIRYLDVYVKQADGFTNGSLASDWDIYGYVCMVDNDDITPAGDTTTTGAVKTNGFVAATNDNVNMSADSYYTFNVTVSKSLANDNPNNSHQFPVHVDFTNAAVTNNVLLMANPNGAVSDYAHTAAAASSLDGLAKIANGGSIKYIGIPCGTTVTVYETNDVAGVSYDTTLTVDGTTGLKKTITATDTPSQFATYTERDYNSLSGVVTTTANTIDNTEGLHTIVIANVFSVISPTGVIIRILPFAIIVGGAVVLLVVLKRTKAKKDTRDI